jgi:twinkle protein
MLHIKSTREMLPATMIDLTQQEPSVAINEFSELTNLFGGFRMHEFSILCGSTGSGKTSFLANLSAQLLRGGLKHFVMSVECGAVDYLKRVISVLADEDLNTGEAHPKEKIDKIFNDNRKELYSELIEFAPYDSRVPIEEVIKDLEWAVAQGCKMAFLDNLNFFLQVTSDQNSLVEMDRVTHELIMFAKRNPIHIILVMHPKKTVSGRVQSEFDIKGSSTAVQEASNVFLWNRPDHESPLSRFDRELYVAKLRKKGVNTGKTIIFDGSTPRYREAGKHDIRPSAIEDRRKSYQSSISD